MTSKAVILGTESPRYGAMLNNIAMLCEETGRADEAEKLYREALAVYERNGRHIDAATLTDSERSLINDLRYGLADDIQP
jgi:hypothetical protein